MLMKRLCLLVACAALSALAAAGPKLTPVTVIQPQNQAAFLHNLKVNGFRVKGGIAAVKTDPNNKNSKSFPHFASSFTYQGTTYPYTMVGYAPESGKSTKIRPVIIPLRMKFVFFETDMTFDPAVAVDNIVKSPIFNSAAFANGVGQFGDQLQRATFWNRIPNRGLPPPAGWHVLFDTPRVLPTVTVLVEPDIGELIQVGPNPTDILGNMRFGAMDSTIHTLLQFVSVQPDELPIFVTQNVFADALGYHDAFALGQNDGSDILQTLVYTSWLDINLVGPLLADISTLNHEVGEWLNDPYVNNIVPLWNYPNITVCGDNPFLEVGDPQGNGPNFADFPTIPISLNGFTYHLQDLVMLPWFTGESPSSAQNGWYDFPGTNEIHAPFQPCGGS